MSEPQDRKKKKPSVKEVDQGKKVTFPSIYARSADGKIIEKDGNKTSLSVTVPNEALDDFELLDDLRGLDDGNAARMPGLLRRLVGADFKSVMEALRDRETGRVSITVASDWVMELIEAISPNS